MPFLKSIYTLIQLILLIYVTSSAVKAQSLSYIPHNEPNTRFGSQDVFASEIVRPALTIRGFDSSTLEGGKEYGLGLKQVLEEFLSGEESIEEVIQKVISIANSTLKTPTGTLDEKRIALDFNSRVTQSRAFVALASYVLEKNDYDASQSQSAFGKTHTQALQSLKDALVNPPGGNYMGLDLVTDSNGMIILTP